MAWHSERYGAVILRHPWHGHVSFGVHCGNVPDPTIPSGLRALRLAALLQQARELAVAEEGIVTWYAFRLGEATYGIFDTLAAEDARQAHLSGQIRARLGEVGPTLLAADPSIQQVDIVAVK